MKAEDHRKRVYTEQMENYKQNIVDHRKQITAYQKLLEKWWDKPSIYRGLEERIAFEQGMIAFYKLCVLQLGTGKRKW